MSIDTTYTRTFCELHLHFYEYHINSHVHLSVLIFDFWSFVETRLCYTIALTINESFSYLHVFEARKICSLQIMVFHEKHVDSHVQ